MHLSALPHTILLNSGKTAVFLVLPLIVALIVSTKTSHFDPTVEGSKTPEILVTWDGPQNQRWNYCFHLILKKGVANIKSDHALNFDMLQKVLVTKKFARLYLVFGMVWDFFSPPTRIWTISIAPSSSEEVFNRRHHLHWHQLLLSNPMDNPLFNLVSSPSITTNTCHMILVLRV